MAEIKRMALHTVPLPDYGFNTAAAYGPRIKGYTDEQMHEHAKKVNAELLTILAEVNKLATTGLMNYQSCGTDGFTRKIIELTKHFSSDSRSS